MKIQAFFLASAALGLAFATANGCTVTTDDSGTGGSGGATTSGGEGGNQAAGVGGSTTTSMSGGGGAGSCVSCAEYLTNMGGVPCGLSADETTCEAGSSCEKLGQLSACTCDATMGCEAECPVSCGTDAMGDDSKCQACVSDKCSAELTACSNDA